MIHFDQSVCIVLSTIEREEGAGWDLVSHTRLVCHLEAIINPLDFSPDLTLGTHDALSDACIPSSDKQRPPVSVFALS